MPKKRIPTLDDCCTFFEAVPQGVVGIDNEGCIVVLNIRMASMFGYSREELIGKPIETLVPRRFRAGHSGFRQAFALFPRNRPMGVGKDFFGQRKDGSEFPVEIALNPLTGTPDSLILATVIDISVRKRFEEERKRLIAELNDRIVSVFGAIHFLAANSLVGERPARDGRDAFIARLHSLAQAHALLAAEQGVPLRGLLEAQLAAFSKQFDIGGAEVTLRHGAALKLTILFHELTVNAAKYGALSVPEGRLSIRWTIDKNIHPAVLFFLWEETEGPSVAPPTHTGFGRMMIEQIARELGKPRSNYAANGLKYELELPLDEIGWIREWSS